jgi:SNF2 family DNA or RNA helicase
VNNFTILPLPKAQSLGYLVDGQSLRCVESFGTFRTGHDYRVRPFQITAQRTVKRPHVTGPEHEHLLSGHDLGIGLTDNAGKEWLFVSRRYRSNGFTITIAGRDHWPDFDLEILSEKFAIQPPMDLATANQSWVDYNTKFLECIEAMVNAGKADDFSFKRFQSEDLAKLALVDGSILAYQPGMGKSLMGIAWALLKVGLHPNAGERLFPAEPVLIISPGGLLDQLEADYRTLLGPAFPGCTRILSQSDFAAILARNKGHLAPGFYLASYETVALNRFQALPIVPDGLIPPEHAKAYQDYFGVDSIDECRRISTEAAVGLGEEHGGVQCVYRPALADLLKDYFAAVVIDEATRLKSGESIIAMGVRSLRPKYRLLLTGTPIKNRLPDLLFLAAWVSKALDHPTDQWPYSSSIEAFSKDFLVTDVDKTLEARIRCAPGRAQPKKEPRRTGLPTAEICNVQKLWRVLAPVVLRRRKCDISEQEIAAKIHRPVIVPMGTAQVAVYKWHLEHAAYDRRGQPAVGAKMQALRVCAAAPCSESLGKVRSTKPFTPKVHACLQIVREVLERKEQVVIFSPFHEPLDILSRYMAEASVRHDVLDGRMSPSKRAVLATNFKRGLPSANPVLLAGLRACAEGYSWHLCNNVILYAYDWALDLMRQAIDRVHRINSVKAVNVYSLITAGTIERKLSAMLDEKGGAADLALDGRVGVFETEEMHFEDLLELAKAEFTEAGLIDESTCERAWPELRSALQNLKL